VAMQKLRPLAGLYGILDATEEGGERTQSLLSAVARQLAAAGLEVAASPVVVSDDQTALKTARHFREKDPDLLVALVITWSFDHLHLAILRRVDRPLAIIAVPGIRAGSIVGAHQLGSFLADLGAEHRVFYGDPDSPGTYAPIAAYALAAAARGRLRTGRIATVGRRTPGMTPIAVDEVEVTRTIGPLVENYGWDEIQELARAVSGHDAAAGAEDLRRQAGTVASAEAAIDESTRLAIVLRKLAAERGILAYGIGCYPHYAGRVCSVVGVLTDEGIPCGCEGDMNSAILMWLLQSFTGQPAHFGEILEVDETRNTIVSSHCGCGAPSQAARAKDVSLVPVRLFDRGVCIRFPARASPRATYANLTGRRGTYRLLAVGGSAEETGMVFEGNPVAMKPALPVRRLMDAIAGGGFGHHWMMGYDDAVEPLMAFCKLTGIRGVFPGMEG
jgi:L-fucose isomerase-like protein